MKIYFAGSIRGGRDDKELYFQIINFLKNYGEVLTEYVGDPNLSSFGEVILTDEQIYERDIEWLKKADVFVGEVSTPSVGVGYEIAFAEILNKKILCLYRDGAPNRISGMINGNKNLKIKTYKTMIDLVKIFVDFFD